ncbi:MAG TPA: AarF/ABC1/UbiB kinase family protein [Candidatus Acetothermia bacterium]|nr:AarF/ABC1/UbiB kinase family protein [Candidatus Acetothermia bacterium]HEX32540.1 AarF/ABC1/UbiB kinase family protein [Candidatus Acetothermia bacterium]
MVHRIGSLSRTYRHITRYREIIRVLVKHGFGDLVTRSNLERYVDRGRKLLPGQDDRKIASLSRWERIRMVLEELGPTFIKFGQIMSNRPDLVPQELIAELAKLQSDVPPFSDAEARDLIEEELDRPISEIFAEYSPTPIASASIAQVHKATLLNGEEVAIKVQRPGIEQIIKTDLEIMFDLAALMEKHIQEMDILHPVSVVVEFERSINKEIDFTIEATSIERFGRNFQDETTIYVPKVYRDYSTSKVLTMEFIDGVKASSAEVLINAGLDPKLLASRGADLVLKQVFEHGFFHADPHPGNMVALPGNVVCFLDFGMMGGISPAHREALSNILVGIVNQDAASITKTVLKLAHNQYIEDAEQLEYEIYELLEQYSYRSLKSVNMGVMLNQMVTLVVKHRLKIPPNFSLISKALITIEGVGRVLDPDFDMVKHTEPFAKKLLSERLNPLKLTKDFYLSAIDLSILLRDLPAQTREILTQIKEGRTRIEFEHRGLDPMLKTHERISNRISFSIVLSSLIVGSALIMRADIPPNVYGVPIIGALGFVAAGVMGFWLLISILRHGKM